jgi:AcrR family transcriptional regulator
MATSISPSRTPRQAEIVRVATELFARDGYRAVGMRSIAEAVGIRTSSLYHHFASKEELLFAISLDVTRDFIEEHIALLAGPEPAAPRLATLVRHHVAYFTEHRLEQTVSRRELRELSSPHVEQVVGYLRQYQTQIERFIAEAVARGEFRVPDARVAALAMLDMLNGISGWFRESGTLTPAQLGEVYAELVLELVGAQKPGARLAPGLATAR